ncbi:MAG TPA: polymer-forming cytoskeletal protein, partial [Candidatus Saccharimonadales bacterium]|nr:polymer-forming cytoskeletal protein [Candidatus Saccharimonadales bacterium]
VKVKGNLASDGDIMIDGTLSGEIKAAGNVTLGVNAVVKADITAHSVTVAGKLQGDIKAETEAGLTESCQVKGTITAATVSILPGAVFIGSVVMTETETQVLLDQDETIRSSSDEQP